MISEIEALNYRALHYVKQSLAPFQVLIGPNASGKTTFLDTIALIGELLRQSSMDEVLLERAPDFRDMTWKRQGTWFEIALESRIPDTFKSDYSHLRYEIRLGLGEETQEVSFQVENLWFIHASEQKTPPQRHLFPHVEAPARVTQSPNARHRDKRKIVGKTDTGNDYFKSENTDWNNMFRLGPKRPALANLPEDTERFPVSTWFKRQLTDGVQRIMLNSLALRRPSPPQASKLFAPDGSNLPRLVYELEQKHPERLKDWIAHVRTALPDIDNITTIERPEDRHRYIVLHYHNRVQVPSWTISDGTLRLLALTILAYMPDISGIYLIEEPENGIHPRAVEAVLQSLQSVYNAQVLVATHSPVVLQMLEPHQLLCFSRTNDGETDVVRGDLHPRLREWQRDVSLDTLFGIGVLE